MWLSIIIPVLLGILVIVCVLLTLVVLMQRPKNEGLGAAFGSGVTENIFGAQTATVLTKATVYLGCIFFALTLLLTVLTARQSVDRRVGVLEKLFLFDEFNGGFGGYGGYRVAAERGDRQALKGGC